MDDRRGGKGMPFDADDVRRRVEEARDRAKVLRSAALELERCAKELESEVGQMTDVGRINEKITQLEHALKGSLGAHGPSSAKGSLG